jgi:hypothetical protein
MIAPGPVGFNRHSIKVISGSEIGYQLVRILGYIS